MQSHFPDKNVHRGVYAIARTVGWLAHWKEMIDDPSQRIGRPRHLYTGATERTFVPMEARSKY
jgi:citrate synthase